MYIIHANASTIRKITILSHIIALIVHAVGTYI